MTKKIRAAEVSLLREIDNILANAKYYQSRQSGKRFYDQPRFASKLKSYVAGNRGAIKAQATRFGMSAATLEKIIAGGALSENMLVRIRSVLASEANHVARKQVFAGDWRQASSDDVRRAISDVADKLVFLKRVIEGNNFLTSYDSPIDKIQVLQLISLLAATLEAIRAPFVDTKHTLGFFRWLTKFAKASAQKGLEKIVVDAMHEAAKAGTDLIHHLPTKGGISDIGNIIT